MVETLEKKFESTLGEWKKHIEKNGMHSSPWPYVDCQPFKDLVSMGRDILPYMREEIKREVELVDAYDIRLRKIKKRLFGDENLFLYGETFHKACDDKEYQEYQEDVDKNLSGRPGQFWCYLLRQIVGEDFAKAVTEESGSVKKEEGFVKVNVNGVTKFALKWLEENADRYQ